MKRQMLNSFWTNAKNIMKRSWEKSDGSKRIRDK